MAGVNANVTDGIATVQLMLLANVIAIVADGIATS